MKNGKRTYILSYVSAIMLALMVFSGDGHGQVRMQIGGTGTALGSLNVLGKAFQELHPDITVVVLPSLGSSGGIRAVAKGIIDIGVTGRPLEDAERDLGLRTVEYANTPLVPVAHPDVRTEGLSSDQIISIYKGEMQTWPDGGRLRPVMRPEGESDTLRLRQISTAMNSAVEAAHRRQGMLVAMTDQECADLIQTISGAFGFSTLAQVISEKRRVKILSYNGVVPDVQALEEGRYLLFKSLSFVIQGAPPEHVRRFIRFVASDQGKKILRETGNLAVIGSAGVP